MIRGWTGEGSMKTYSIVIGHKDYFPYTKVIGHRACFSRNLKEITEHPELCMVDTVYDYRYEGTRTKFYPESEKDRIEWDDWGRCDDRRTWYQYIRLVEE